MKNEEYESAITLFEELDGYNDSNAKMDECCSKQLAVYLTELLNDEYFNKERLNTFLQHFVKDENRLTTDELSEELCGYSVSCSISGANTFTNELWTVETNSEGELGIYCDALDWFHRSHKGASLKYQDNLAGMFCVLGNDILIHRANSSTNYYMCYFRLCKGIYIQTGCMYDRQADELLTNIESVHIKIDSPLTSVDEIRELFQKL